MHQKDIEYLLSGNMTLNQFQYCAAIRTLGTAGNKYLETLSSLARQSIKPKKILVYIAEGYPLPKETIGIEEYIYCPKGMIAQRALPFDEIDTEWILFLDDDLRIPDDGIEKLFEGIERFDADCIAPNIYPNHNLSVKNKILAIFRMQTYPHWDKRWAFKIRKSGHYSYNNHPAEILPTQSNAGACFLCRKEAFQRIHFEDEMWLNSFKYALGDDQLFHYKLYKYGYKVLTHFNCPIKHLDAQAGGIKNHKEKNLCAIASRFLVWYRTIFSIQKNIFGKTVCWLAFLGTNVIYFLFSCINALRRRKWYVISNIWKGNIEGYKYAHSEKYLSYPDFLAHFSTDKK